MVIDAHIHYLPQEAIDKATVSGGFDYRALLKGELSLPYKRLQDLEEILGIMEGAGVDMAVLNNASWAAQGLEVCKALNDGYARVGREYPEKFISCGHITLQPGQETVDEAERCITELGLKGLSMVSSLPDITPDSPELWPIYEKLSQLDVPMVVHPSVRFPLWEEARNTRCAERYPENTILPNVLWKSFTAC